MALLLSPYSSSGFTFSLDVKDCRRRLGDSSPTLPRYSLPHSVSYFTYLSSKTGSCWWMPMEPMPLPSWGSTKYFTAGTVGFSSSIRVSCMASIATLSWQYPVQAASRPGGLKTDYFKTYTAQRPGRYSLPNEWCKFVKWFVNLRNPWFAYIYSNSYISAPGLILHFIKSWPWSFLVLSSWPRNETERWIHIR